MASSASVSFENWFKQQHPNISDRSVSAVLRLRAEDATIPFIARYRKEATGNLDEVGIQAVFESKDRFDTIVQRQAHIVKEIEAQGKLTPELKTKILSTFDQDTLEDVYLPFKKKKKSKAAAAKEAGIEPLADWIWNCGHGTETPQPGQTLEIWAFTFRNEEKGIKDAAAAIQGAEDILTERLAEIQDLRQLVRKATFEKGGLRTGKGAEAKPNSKYEKYFDFFEPVKTLLQPQNSHRYLAMRRGWLEKELSLSVGAPPTDTETEVQLLAAFEGAACPVKDSVGASILLKAAKMAFKAHVMPAIEREVHRDLRAVADEVAVTVFSENVRTVLLASPFGPKAVLGVDPGVRTGCKVALVDDSGKFIGSGVFFLNSEGEKVKAKEALSDLFKNVTIQAIAVGNGTHGRESEMFVREVLKEKGMTIPVVLVSESGASVYSASEAAREEFPELDITIRGAISIARRLQDPLAELVKVDPKSIGVGQYQHDISPSILKKSLSLVVDSCVNSVGVNLNTASYHLLAHVSGIGDSLAKNVVGYRTEKGLFKSRQQLLEVPSFSTKSFEQAAGFLRIPDGENPLDNTAVHPERYSILDGFAEKMGKPVRDLMGGGVAALKAETALRAELGEFTFDDIVAELEKPGRDPRETFIPFSFRDDIKDLKDLQKDMACPGIVTNVTNFGAFVDIGVHQDGLVHISQLADKFVKDPREVVKPGDRVNVRVLEVNLEKSQIALTMRSEKPVQQVREPRQPREQRPQQAREPRRDNRPQQGQAQGAQQAQRRPSGPPRPQRPVFRNDAFSVLASLKSNTNNKKQ